MTKFLNISTDDTLGGVSPSDEIVVSQKAIKTYVDNQGGGGSGYHPDIFDWKWSDYEISDMQWLCADTFSWQDGTVYEAAFQHLQDDMLSIEPHGVHPCFYATAADQTAHTNQFMYYTAGYVAGAAHPYCYVTWDSPNVQIVYADVIAGAGDAGSTLYNGSGVSATSVGTIYSAGTTISGPICEFLVETVAGTNIVYYVAQDGHKFCRPSQENNIETIYAATGVAWYYIYDYDNTQFKLPRGKHNKYADTLGVVGNASIGFCSNQYTDAAGLQLASSGYNAQFSNIATSLNRSTNVRLHDDPTKSGVIAQQKQDTDQYKHLYFYVGNFTESAVENTAGLNASLFNNKADLDFGNTPMIDYIVAKQDPSAGNNYTWYRKYKSGWVEQGGKISSVAHNSHGLYTLPVTMADTNYAANAWCAQVTSSATFGASSTVAAAPGSTTQVRIGQVNASSATMAIGWEVKGMAA